MRGQLSVRDGAAPPASRRGWDVTRSSHPRPPVIPAPVAPVRAEPASPEHPHFSLETDAGGAAAPQAAPPARTSLLHEAEEVVQELLSLGVVVQLVQLQGREEQGSGWRGWARGIGEGAFCCMPCALYCQRGVSEC